MENLERAKQLIEQAQNIAILPSPDLQGDSFPASLALFYSLKKIAKNVNLLVSSYPQKYDFLVQPGLQLEGADFLISIKEKGLNLSQLSYQKTADGLELFLKTKGQELKPENISLEKLDQSDLLITIGISHFETASDLLAKEPGQIIDIDNQNSNERYGAVNLVNQNYPTLSEIAFKLICSLDEQLLDKPISDCLLGGILEQTTGLQNNHLNSSTFETINCLIKQGAELKETASHFYSILHQKAIGVFGRVLAKLNIDEDKSLAWAILKKEDFVQVSAQPTDLKFTFNKLSSGFFPFQNFFCLWEHANSPVKVFGVFYSPEANQRANVLGHFNGQEKGSGVLFGAGSSDIEETKDKLAQLLN